MLLRVNMVRLHLGCGSNLLEGYINIDKYYDPSVFQKRHFVFRQTDALYLNFGSNSVDEVYHQHFIEHLSFLEEKQAFNEWYRVLKKGGKLRFDVLDFEWIVSKWLLAKDEWISFYESKDDHYFGHGYDTSQRWGVLTAHIFGNGSHDGQYHKNCFTKKKIENILEYFNYSDCKIEYFNYDKFKELRCLRVEAIK